MEYQVLNISFTISSFKFLNEVSSIRREDFDNVATTRCRGNQGTIRVDSHSSNLGVVMSQNLKIDAFIDDLIITSKLLTKIQDLEMTFFGRRKANDFALGLFGLGKGD